MWTRFMDMRSGGRLKEDFQYLYVELPEDQAKVFFYNRFGHNPERVTCTCCGDDYSISSDDSLEQLTGFDRGCEWNEKTKKYEEMPCEEFSWNDYVTLDDFKKTANIIYKDEIKPEELVGDVPDQGYVWID